MLNYVIARSLHNIGDEYRLLKQHEEAGKWLRDALSMRQFLYNGKIFPVYARKYVTMEEVLEATNNRPSKRSRIKEDSKFVKGFRVCTNKINLEKRMRDND